MAVVKDQVLVVSNREPVRERLARLLQLPSSALHGVADVDAAMQLAGSSEFEIVIVDFPHAGQAIGDLLRVARWSGSLWRRSALVFLAEPQHLDEIESFLGKGVCRILNPGATDETLQRALLEVADAEPRFQVRALLRIGAHDVAGRGTVLAQTQNLSATGMLVRSDAMMALGSHFAFGLEIPGLSQAIRGQASVVRLARSRADGIDGFAARFVGFEHDAQQRLRIFIHQQAQRRRTAATQA